MALIVVLHNTTNLAPISDYRYEVLIGDGTASGSVTIERGQVNGHTRADGWDILIGKLLSQRILDTGEGT